MLQLSARAVEFTGQTWKLCGVRALNLTFYSVRTRQTETLWEKVMRCNAKLATCQWHFFVLISLHLLSAICSAMLAHYVRSWLCCLDWHQWSGRCGVVLQTAVVAALPLLFLAERRIAHLLAQLSGRQRCRLVLSCAGARNQTLVVRLHLCCDQVFHDVFSRVCTAAVSAAACNIFQRVDLLDDFFKDLIRPRVPSGML